MNLRVRKEEHTVLNVYSSRMKKEMFHCDKMGLKVKIIATKVNTLSPVQ